MGKFGSSLRTLAATLSFVALAGGAWAVQGTAQEAAQVKAVYHLTNGLEEAQRAIRNVRNHLNADPNAKIVVVGNGKGIDFMLEGAKDSNGSAFDASIQDLASKGVEFRLCKNTIVSRKIDRSRVVPYVKIVPSGVAEVAALQVKEHYAYVRP